MRHWPSAHPHPWVRAERPFRIRELLVVDEEAGRPGAQVLQTQLAEPGLVGTAFTRAGLTDPVLIGGVAEITAMIAAQLDDGASTAEVMPGPPVAASDDALISMVWATFSRQTARDFSAATPPVNVSLTGSARLTATMSVTPRPSVSLRRHGQIEVTLRRLIQLGTIDATLAAFLSVAVKALQHHRHRRGQRRQDLGETV